MAIQNNTRQTKTERRSLDILIPRMEKSYAAELAAAPEAWGRFKDRVEHEWERLFGYLHELYGERYDFFYTLEQVLDMLVRNWLDRPQAMRALDERRAADPHWFASERMVGIVLYVDLFSDNLKGLRDKIPYFEKLGVTYLHLMPLFAVPHGENDGGSYSHQYLASRARWIGNLLDDGLDVYAYFNNDAEGHAVHNALALKRYVERRAEAREGS